MSIKSILALLYSSSTRTTDHPLPSQGQQQYLANRPRQHRGPAGPRLRPRAYNLPYPGDASPLRTRPDQQAPPLSRRSPSSIRSGFSKRSLRIRIPRIRRRRERQLDCRDRIRIQAGSKELEPSQDDRNDVQAEARTTRMLSLLAQGQVARVGLRTAGGHLQQECRQAKLALVHRDEHPSALYVCHFKYRRKLTKIPASQIRMQTKKSTIVHLASFAGLSSLTESCGRRTPG